MRRVGRRSGDSLVTASLGNPASGDTSATAGGDSTGAVPESAVPERTLERSFKSRKDSIAWDNAHRGKF